ncbi:hypothetical protein H2200_000014 [Cladophialophora chaetospira]|uniref:Histone-lysine N-methyltransferase n=1 Tax=Cladophialophora chaetospira TaxID=386627 RepID=A0AA38XNH8_9EURO|nr:hypothetical protein H2200_000014 [Cladophialophora chaetospira]
MAVAGPMLPAKRRLEDTETNNLNSSPSPPAKRHKSHTPAEKSSQTPLPSRGRPEIAKPRPSAATAPSIPSRGPRLDGVPPTGSQSGSKPAAKKIPIIIDASDSDSPPPPSRRTSSNLPTRTSRNNDPPGSPVFDKVKTVREINTYRSPYNGPPQNGTHIRRREVSQSRSSSSSDPSWEKRRSEASGRTINIQSKNDVRTNGPTASQPSVPPPFTLHIPGKKTLDRGNGAPRPRPRQPSVEVVVNSPSNLLEQFQRPLSISKAEHQAERKETWLSLKHSTRLAHENLALVEKHFGQTGFSKAYSTEDEEELAFMRDAASKKKKNKVNRANINLEIDSIIRSVEDLNISKKLVHPARTARDILTSRFDEQVIPALTFSNDVNTKRLHGKFQFIDRYIIGDKVNFTSSSYKKEGCGCDDCSLSSCSCFTKKIKDRDGKGRYPAQLRTYTRRRNGIMALSDEFLTRQLDPATEKSEITECNASCGCGPGCWNRVVGNGRTVPLEIFQTEKCGFGVRSSQDIVKGQFIELYLGEVITEAELLRRENAENDDDPTYIYSLDWVGSANQNTTYHVDGKYFGSAMRFVNHSCVPNARCFPLQTHEDRKSYYLAFFAIKDIKAGTEIRIDYHSEGIPSGSSQEDPDHQEPDLSGQLPDGLSPCHCGEKSCRGIIWQPGVKTRRRRRQRD